MTIKDQRRYLWGLIKHEQVLKSGQEVKLPEQLEENFTYEKRRVRIISEDEIRLSTHAGDYLTDTQPYVPDKTLVRDKINAYHVDANAGCLGVLVGYKRSIKWEPSEGVDMSIRRRK